MTVARYYEQFDSAGIGERMHAFIAELYPICRSITGDGLRQTLRRIQSRIPLQTHEIPTGTCLFDWTAPREWNIRDAWIKNRRGEKVVDFQRSNLHVVNYSVPFSGRLSLAELRPHLHTLSDRPEWIPYRTSYYREDWGFCLAQKTLDRLADDEYEVHIDSDLKDGALTYGELLLPGKRSDEVLISCHVCHPSLANDNLSGIAVATTLAEILAPLEREYSYRFLFIPGTIGSIAWLARNEERTARIRHGLTIACVGDGGKFHYKRSRRGEAEIDHAVIEALRHRPEGFEVRDFSPYGYDERQYCSPGFNLPVGGLSRTPHGQFPEYHTSADNLDFVRPESLAASLHGFLSVFSVLEGNKRYLNTNPKCEPQLGRRGLYRAVGGHADAGQRELAMLWTLNLSDGERSLLQIAERSQLPFPLVRQAADALSEHGLLVEVSEAG